MSLLAVGFLLSSCGDDDDGNGQPTIQPMNVISITANNQTLNNNAQNIARELEIVILFNNALNTSAFNSAFSWSSSGGAVPANVSFSDSDSRVTITNTMELEFLTQYTLTVAAGELGANGEELANDYTISFTTVDEILFSGGEGTAGDPFKIGNAEDLALINSYLGDHFIQISDIDLTGAGGETGWAPIGSDEFPFVGSYNGDGFGISNLVITSESIPDALNYRGLFGVIDGAEISNMNVSTGSAGVTGRVGTGVLIGQMRSGTVTGCHTSGNIFGNVRTGGLIGDMETGTVHQCSSSATVISEASRAGGLIGIVSDPNTDERPDVEPGESTISESFATGNVTSGSPRAGGLVGSMDRINTPGGLGSIINCYATGNVTATNRVASIIGFLAGEIRNSYGTGNVTLMGPTWLHPGFAIGELRNAEGTFFENIYYDENIVVEGEGVTTVPDGRGEPVDISTLACGDPNATFPGFDFGGVWSCQDGEWPKLAWQD